MEEGEEEGGKAGDSKGFKRPRNPEAAKERSCLKKGYIVLQSLAL